MIVAFDPDGSNRRVAATGLRNAVSMSVHPGTGRLWTTNQERDALGDNLVPDFLTSISQGQFFGWPWFYIGNHRDSRPRTDPPKGLPPVRVPTLLFQAHSSSLGSTFYTNDQFP